MADVKQDLYGLEYSANFSIDGLQEADINLSLTPASGVSGTVFGTVTDGTDPIPDATVKLFDSKGQPFQHTMTDAEGAYTLDGEFAFYDVADGVYTVLASAEGYQAAPMTATILNGSISNMTIVMAVDARTYNGTVSGIIRDQGGTAVAGCFVGLFRIVDGAETLVAATKTNAAGKYLFGGVTGGEYLVKAKLEA